MIEQIKENLIEYHRGRGFAIYESFPLLAKDPTVLFVGATITPFKHFFSDPSTIPHNYALIQRCLRVGGGAGEINTAYEGLNYSSLFDMFGSGLFGHTHESSVDYFLDMLSGIGLSRKNLRFTVPLGTKFAGALLKSGVEDSAIFTISENGEFWQQWRFGRNDLLGKGLTAIYACNGDHVTSATEMADQSQRFVEIGNLIHIYGKAEEEQEVPIPYQGFEVGMGVERLAIILQGRTLYEISPLKEFMEMISEKLGSLGGENPSTGLLRVTISHLRSINALIQEGVRPGNKMHAFVLRKLIRSLLEMLWLSIGRIISLKKLIQDFAERSMPESATLITGVFSEEEEIFLRTLERARQILVRDPLIDADTLKGTYGIRPSLLPLLKS